MQKGPTAANVGVVFVLIVMVNEAEVAQVGAAVDVGVNV